MHSRYFANCTNVSPVKHPIKMFVIPDLHLNKLSDVRIPSGRQLFERYGFSQPTGHPDNTDPYKFSEPSNIMPNALQRFQSIQTRTRYVLTLEQRERAKMAAAAAEETKSGEEAMNDNERSEEE